MFLLHAETTTRASFATSLKRSAKKFFEAALEGGWSVTTESTNGGTDRIKIIARDLNTALTHDSGSTYYTQGPLVQVVGWFRYDTGGYDSHRVNYVYAKVDRNGQVERKIDDQWSNDKINELVNLLTKHGPIARKQRAERQAQRDAELAATKLRHEALLASRKALGDSELGKRVREHMSNLLKAPTTLDLTGRRTRDYGDALDQFQQRQELVTLAEKVIAAEYKIMGEAPNERCLSIEEAAAYVADKQVARLVDTIYYDASLPESKARRKFIQEFHPIYGERYRDFDMRGVFIPRD